MAGEDTDPAPEEKSIHLVERPNGEEIALGMTAKLEEGMTQVDQKGMSAAADEPPVAPPPKPPDASASAKPKQ